MVKKNIPFLSGEELGLGGYKNYLQLQLHVVTTHVLMKEAITVY